MYVIFGHSQTTWYCFIITMWSSGYLQGSCVWVRLGSWLSLFFLLTRWYTLSPARLDSGDNFLHDFFAQLSPLSTRLLQAYSWSRWSPWLWSRLPCAKFTVYNSKWYTDTLQNRPKPFPYLNSLHSFILFFRVFLPTWIQRNFPLLVVYIIWGI